jgi:NTP pyrophosphatase (non-canonical NTP hydrolase)
MTIINDYVDSAKRTESIVLGLNDLSLRLLHSSMGLATEIIEFNETYHKNGALKQLDIVNLLEEIGDMFWYIAIGCDIFKINFSNIIFSLKNEKFDLDTRLYSRIAENNIGAILDKCKRQIFYRKIIDEVEYKELYIEVIKNLYKLVISMGYEFEPLLQKNIDKLKARYPDKYSDHNAINRDLEEERRILEN